MTAGTVRKAIAVLFFLFGAFLFLLGGYYLWTSPIEHGWEGMVSIAAGLLLHVIFWAMWP